MIKDIGTWLSLLSPIGMVLTWFLTKRHFQVPELREAEANADMVQVDVIVKKLEIYQNILDDLEIRHENMLKKRDAEIAYLEQKVINLELRIRGLELDLSKK